MKKSKVPNGAPTIAKATTALGKASTSVFTAKGSQRASNKAFPMGKSILD